MSKPAFLLRMDSPKDHRHRLGSYGETLKWDNDKPADRPSTKLLSGMYVALTDQVHQWFVHREITYKLGHNNKVGFFVRVPLQHVIMAKLTWG